MKIDTKKDGNVLTHVLEGGIDTVSAPDWERALKNDLDGVDELRLDFGGVTFISSAGIRVILWAYKALPAEKRKVVIKNAGTEIREVFNLTGITRLLTFE